MARHDEWMAEELAQLRAGEAMRTLEARPGVGGRYRVGGQEWLNFASNDYLDLARHPRVLAAAGAAVARWGAGAGASRLVTGTLPIHDELEERLAALKGCPAALVGGSGYAVNLGVIPALVGRGDAVLLDRLAHASLVDGAVLSRASLHRFRHNDPAHLEALLAALPAAGRKLVVTESVFSMDGDLAPLPELAAASERHGAMTLVDEAHATGIFGAGGAGRVVESGLSKQITVSMGTLSKALGSFGGFTAGSRILRDWLINRSRPFIYSTALPPSAAGAALGALAVLRDEPGGGAELLRRAAFFKAGLTAAGFPDSGSCSQIVPVLVGDNGRALRLAARLREAGILVVAIRPPTVPEGTARLRFAVTLAHTEAGLARTVQALAAASRAEGLLQ